jgi:DNA polymerase-1
MIVLSHYDITVGGPLFDTMIADYVLYSERPHKMDSLAEAYLKYKTIHYEDVVGSGRQQKTMREVSPSEVVNYAAEDADVTLKLKHILEKELEQRRLTELFEDIEMPLVRVLMRMEMYGARIDTTALKETSALFTEKMLEIEREIHDIAGTELNISSPKQIGELLFDKLKLVDKAKKTKKGQYVTDEATLQALKGKHKVVGMILDYRGYKKLLSTYIDALPLLINPRTGHIHTSYNQAVTSTGRLSSSNPNLQNIPIRDENGKEVRKAFIPDEGELFFSADYSQIELRLMAHMSGDKTMIDDFNSGHDIHQATAAKIFKCPIEDVTSDMRRKAKTANFGIIYGISAFGLAERMEVSRTEAKNLIDEYFQTYPGVKTYMEESVEKARKLKYTETLFGRQCQVNGIDEHNAVVRGYAERNAINAPIQGTAADIIKIAMIRIDKRLQEEGLRSKMILQVHDELNFSVVPEEKDIIEQIVRTEMENATQLSVPLIVDCGWGKNWLEAH